MTTSLKSPSKKQVNSQSRYLWYGLGAALVIFAAVAYFVSRSGASPFSLTGAEESSTIFLRIENEVQYEFTYNGNVPVRLTRIIPQLQLFQGQVIVADVEEVRYLQNDEWIALDVGSAPEGVELEIQPGESFTIEVVYLGQELGWNRIYGFRIEYEVDGQMRDGTITLEDDYYIFVE